MEEIADAVFSRSIERSNSPFFPGAARDLFASIIAALVRNGLAGGADVRGTTWNDAVLRRYIDRKATRGGLRKLFSSPFMADQASVLDYLGTGESSEQGDGVFAEMKHALRRLFRGCFAHEGSFSVCNFVRNRATNALFVEYDPSRESSLAPAYGLVIDLAPKEGFGRGGGGGLFVFADEFRLLPKLAIWATRSTSAALRGSKSSWPCSPSSSLSRSTAPRTRRTSSRAFARCSSSSQTAGTRTYVRDRFGTNAVVDSYRSATGGVTSSTREVHVAEDWDLFPPDGEMRRGASGGGRAVRGRHHRRTPPGVLSVQGREAQRMAGALGTSTARLSKFGGRDVKP